AHSPFPYTTLFRSWMAAAVARDGGHIAEARTVGPDELPFEFMLNALRLKDGVAASSFQERTGLSLAVIAQPLQAAAKRGLLDPDPTRLRATPLGWRVLNALPEMLLETGRPGNSPARRQVGLRRWASQVGFHRWASTGRPPQVSDSRRVSATAVIREPPSRTGTGTEPPGSPIKKHHIGACMPHI